MVDPQEQIISDCESLGCGRGTHKSVVFHPPDCTARMIRFAVKRDIKVTGISDCCTQ